MSSVTYRNKLLMKTNMIKAKLNSNANIPKQKVKQIHTEIEQKKIETDSIFLLFNTTQKLGLYYYLIFTEPMVKMVRFYTVIL